MRYISTRGGVAPCSFEQVLFDGLAADGGLYLPETWPRFERDEIASWQGQDYATVATRVLLPFVADDLGEDELAAMVSRAYVSFRHPAIAPLVQLEANDWLMELFHGPTLAFKDIALQLLSLLFEHFLARRDHAITIVGATSGDTGAAAIAACANRARMRVVILHPRGRISEVQRRQMTTVDAANVHNIAIEGTFDDCQRLVKALFGDRNLRRELNLAAINSINWGRIMAQSVYYVTASLALGGPWRQVGFVVPSGNFGDVYAGYVAAALGVPVGLLAVATNRNDILARFFATGSYQSAPVQPTMSPAMDIQVASNFERLLFDLCARDGALLREKMAVFAETGRLAVAEDALGHARELFDAASVSEEETAASMKDTLKRSGHLIDPHSAIGVQAVRRLVRDPAMPLITLATAHPSKFPDAVLAATGVSPTLPRQLDGLMQLKERMAVLPCDLAAVRRHIQTLPAQPQGQV